MRQVNEKKKKKKERGQNSFYTKTKSSDGEKNTRLHGKDRKSMAS